MFWFFLIVAVLAFSLPKTFKYFVAVPMFGTFLGGFIWGLTMMYGLDVASFRNVVAFIVGGCVVSLFMTLLLD